MTNDADRTRSGNTWPPGAGARQSGPAQGATGQLREGLAHGVQYPEQMPKRYKKLSAIDLYAQFLTTMLDWKGLCANGYGSSGWQVSLSAAVDAGSFVLPGLVSIAVETSASATVADSVVVSIHRSMPNVLNGLQPRPALGNAAAPIPTAPLAIWESSVPVCLMALFGKSFSAQVTAGASIGMVRELPEISQANAQQVVTQISSMTEIPLALEVGAAADANVRYDRLYARDPQPGWYISAMDAGLKADFNRVLMPGKTTTKQEIIAWIQTFHRQIHPLNQATFELAKTRPAALYLSILNTHLGLLQQRRPENQSGFTALFKKARERAQDLLKISFPTTAWIFSKIDDLIHSLEAKTYQTAELQNIVRDLMLLIPPDSFIQACQFDPSVLPGEIRKIQGVFQSLKQQLVEFDKRLSEPQASDQTSVPSKPDSFSNSPGLRPSDQFNCFLKVVSHQAGGYAGVSAQGLSAYARAGITGSYKKTVYRYQTFTPSRPYRQALVYTQDTSITYRQAKVDSAVGAVSIGQGVQKDLLMRGMTYQSACVYWRYPTQTGTSALWAKAEPGSGLSYGVSIRKTDLIRCINELNSFLPSRPGASLPKPMPPGITSYQMICRLADYLRLSVSHLVSFLKRRNVVYLEQAIATDSVLLEANYAFPAETYYVLDAKDKFDQANQRVPVYRMRSLWEGTVRQGSLPPLFTRLNIATPQDRPSLCNEQLQAIRIRARMADYRESEISFKLSIPSSLVDTAITLSKIEMAGQEGIREIDSDYFTSESYDQCVPPVIIFHQ